MMGTHRAAGSRGAPTPFNSHPPAVTNSTPRRLGDGLLVSVLVLTTISFSWKFGGFHLGVAEIFLALAAVVLVPVLIKNPLPAGYLAFAYLYFTWCVTSQFWTEDNRASLGPMIQYIQFILIATLVFSTASSEQSVARCLRGYIAASCLLATAVVIYAAKSGSFSYVYFLDYQKNLLGAIVGNSIPLIVALMTLPRNRPWLLRAALVLNICVLFMSTSRGSMIGAVVGTVITLALCNQLRRSVQILATGAVVFFLYITYLAPGYTQGLTDFSRESSAYSRIVIFKDAIEQIRDNFFLGSGIGSYHIELPHIGFSQDDPSNLFLLTMVEVGVIGTFFFVGILGAIASRALRNRELFRADPAKRALSAGLAGAFASHLAHIQMDVSWVRGAGTFMFACVGLMFALARLATDDGRNERSSPAV